MGDGGGGHWLVRMELHPAGLSVCLPLLIFPCTIKTRSSLLAPAHPGGPRKRAVKRLLWWWPPCVADADIIFLPCGFFCLLFFPCLISAIADWMSAILPHMMWPWCEFRMQVWNLLHAARWKCRTQKTAKNLPSGHHHTTLSGYIFATKASIDNREKNLLYSNVSLTRPHSMVNFRLAAEVCGQVWCTPANFNGFCVLAALLHGTLVKGKGKERKSMYIALFGQGGTLKALRHGSHCFTCK